MTNRDEPDFQSLRREDLKRDARERTWWRWDCLSDGLMVSEGINEMASNVPLSTSKSKLAFIDSAQSELLSSFKKSIEAKDATGKSSFLSKRACPSLTAFSE